MVSQAASHAGRAQVSSGTSTSPIKLAIIVADQREVLNQHAQSEPYFGMAPAALLSGLKQTPGVEVHVVCCVRRPVPVPARLEENIFYHAVKVPQWGFLRTAYLPCILGIRQQLRRIQPHIVHGQGTEAYYALAAAHSGFPNVITIHGNMRQVAKSLRAKPFTFHWLMSHQESWTLRRTGGVVCLSRYTVEQVKSLARKTWVVPNAVQEEFFGVVPDPDPIPLLLCVGTVIPYKNQNELIRSLDAAAEKHKFQLLFLGGAKPDDPYSKEFFALLAKRPWCSFKGFASGAALRGYFRSARLLVHPSLEDNCPLVILEAMASGLPVVASRIGGIPDLIEHGFTGALFNPKEPNQIREAVDQALRSGERTSQMAAAARRQAMERYHPKQIALRHLEVYREMLSQ